jgi:hypothetical protein
MSRKTVSEIMVDIASSVNQEATAPSVDSSEYDLWLQFINRSVDEWANVNDWEELRKIYFPSITSDSTSTVSMPTDFRKVATSPKLYSTGTNSSGYEEIPETINENIGLYGPSDKYFTQLGNQSDGISLIFHPATMASGASLEIQYFSTPSSLASVNQIPQMSDSQFVVDRTIAYIFEARSDPRFQQQESKARDKLLQMVENANLSKYNSYSNPQYVQTSPLRKLGFRMGRD